MSFKIKSKYKHVFSVIMASVLLLISAFYNGYPYIYNADTGLYIFSGLQGIVYPHRPVSYGLFIKIFSMQYSLWLVIYIQSLIIAVTLYYYFKYFIKSNNFLLWYLLFVLLISLFTGASFFVSWLMPDIFTALLLLLIGLLIFVKDLKTTDLIIIMLFLIISIPMHNSNFHISLIITLIIMSGYFFKLVKQQYKNLFISVKRLLLVLFMIFFSYIMLSFIHYFYGAGFKATQGGTVFFMGSLIEMGVVDKYLAENCSKKNFEICKYKDTIPNNFLWDEKSPIHKTGGWEGSKKEYSKIVRDIITTPKYLLPIIYKSVMLTLKQFFNYETGFSGIPMDFNKNAVALYYPHEYMAMHFSRQNKGTLNFHLLNIIQNIVVFICYFIYTIVLIYKKLNNKYRFFMLYIILFLFINAWICGTFSMVSFRYQSRLIWLLPLPLFLYMAENIDLKDFYFRFIKKV